MLKNNSHKTDVSLFNSTDRPFQNEILEVLFGSEYTNRNKREAT